MVRLDPVLLLSRTGNPEHALGLEPSVRFLCSHARLRESFAASSHLGFMLMIMTYRKQHHYAYTQNYGPMGILDELHGTNNSFKSWMNELKRRDGVTDVVQEARRELARKEDEQEEKKKKSS